MELRKQTHPKIETYDKDGKKNGYLVPIYNINDNFFNQDFEPKQVYLSVLSPGCSKGPHLHYKRIGFFTCIKGNVKIVVKIGSSYQEYYIGEDYDYASVEVPTGIPALIENISKEDAFLLNMPNPAWTPDMNDEFTADFNDYYNSNGEKANQS